MKEIMLQQSVHHRKILLYSICLMLFIDAIGSGLIMPILPQLFLHEQFGLIIGDNVFHRALFYSLSLALFPLGSILGMPFWGALSDKYGKRRIMLYSIVLLTADYALGIYALYLHNVWLFLLSRIVVGFLAGTYAIAATLIRDMSDNSTENISMFKLPQLITLFGFICGPCVAIFIGDVNLENPLMLPFALALLLGLINICLLYYSLLGIKDLDDIPHGEAKVDFTLNGLLGAAWYTFTQDGTRVLSFSYFCYQFAIALFVQTLSLYLALRFNYTSQQIGTVFVVLALTMAFSMIVVHKLLDYIIPNKLQVMAGLAFLTIIFLFEFTFSNVIAHKTYFSRINLVWATGVLFYLVLPFVNLGFTDMFMTGVSDRGRGVVMRGMGQIFALAWLISGLLVGWLMLSRMILMCVGFGMFASYLLLRSYLKSNYAKLF